MRLFCVIRARALRGMSTASALTSRNSSFTRPLESRDCCAIVCVHGLLEGDDHGLPVGDFAYDAMGAAIASAAHRPGNEPHRVTEDGFLCHKKDLLVGIIVGCLVLEAFLVLSNNCRRVRAPRSIVARAF
jgi:hypothetical protein